MPGAGCARSLACNVRRAHELKSLRSHRFHPAFPARMVLTVSFALSPVNRAFLPPSSPRSLLLKNLTPASRRQDHTTSPSAKGALSSAARPASTASRPAFVTIASRPSVGRDGRGCIADLGVRSMSPIAADWHDGQISNFSPMIGRASQDQIVGWVEPLRETHRGFQNKMGIASAFAR